MLAALLARRPAAVHEQNALPGLGNRMLAPLVQRVCLSFENRAALSPPQQDSLYRQPRASEVAEVDRAAAWEQLKIDPSLKTI